MNLNWNLDILYTSFEDENFTNDKIKFDTLYEELSEIIKSEFLSVENAQLKIETYLKKYTETMKTLFKLLYFGELSMTVDVKNIKAIETIEYCENKLVNITELDIQFKKYIKQLTDLDGIINSSQYLSNLKYFLNEIKENSKYMLSEKEEVAIAKMKTTGSKAWEKLQGKITSNLMIDINIDKEEKKLPLSEIRNLAYRKEADIRKEAYNAEINAYSVIEDSVAACLNSIKGEAITEAELRGYESILEKTLKDARLKKETLNAMLEAMIDSLPYFTTYLKKKAELLNHKNGLPFYDMFAPLGEANIKYTEEEAAEFIVSCFNSFSTKLGNFAKKAFDNNWIDFKPKQGKVGGAFCMNMHPMKESRILANFTGSFNDVSTLAHELGHAYHGECLLNEDYLNSDYTMPIAETASIFCETIIKNAALEKVNKKEAFAILEQDISGATQVVCDIYSRFLFEDEVIKKRKNASLSVEDLKEIMENAQKKAYLDGLDHKYLHPYMWICKPHYYSAEVNYYNFPYTFGLLFSKGLYAAYLKNKETFVAKYDEMLAITGKNNIEDVVAFMGLDVTKKEFWTDSLNLIKHDIDEFIRLSEEL